jgi:hypothetical protein
MTDVNDIPFLFTEIVVFSKDQYLAWSSLVSQMDKGNMCIMCKLNSDKKKPIYLYQIYPLYTIFFKIDTPKLMKWRIYIWIRFISRTISLSILYALYVDVRGCDCHKSGLSWKTGWSKLGLCFARMVVAEHCIWYVCFQYVWWFQRIYPIESVGQFKGCSESILVPHSYKECLLFTPGCCPEVSKVTVKTFRVDLVFLTSPLKI